MKNASDAALDLANGGIDWSALFGKVEFSWPGPLGVPRYNGSDAMESFNRMDAEEDAQRAARDADLGMSGMWSGSGDEG